MSAEDPTRRRLDRAQVPTRVEGVPLVSFEDGDKRDRDDDGPETMLRPPSDEPVEPDADFTDRTKPRLNGSKVVVNGPAPEAPLEPDAIFDDTTRRLHHDSSGPKPPAKGSGAVPIDPLRKRPPMDELPTLSNDRKGPEERERTQIAALPSPLPPAPLASTAPFHGPTLTGPAVPTPVPNVLVNAGPIGAPPPSPLDVTTYQPAQIRTPLVMVSDTHEKRTIVVQPSAIPTERRLAHTPVPRSAIATHVTREPPNALTRAAIIVSCALLVAAGLIVMLRPRMVAPASAATPPTVAVAVAPPAANDPPPIATAVAVPVLGGPAPANQATPAPPPTMSAAVATPPGAHEGPPRKKRTVPRHRDL